MNNFSRKLLTFFISLYTTSSFGSPALRKPFHITLQNGQRTEVVKCGDEHRHWLQTTQGAQLVLTDEQGRYHIASQAESDAFFAKPAAKVKTKRQVEHFQPVFPTTGHMKSLVILVEFEDVKMKSPTAQQDFQRMMTQEGYSELGGTGSARDYYIENSMGVFIPQFDVMGPVTLSHGYAYYGENGSNGDDMRAHEMIIDACRALDNDVDFTQYDYNNDGYIDNVFVFYAGYGEATTSDANTIWPHSYDITECTKIPVMLDGKRLDHYACTNELSHDGVMDGIGTFVHEFGHVLGLPDLYPTQSTNAFSPNIWSVMDEGEYNNDSRTPPYFTVYERYALGWLNPIEVLEDGCSIAINDISTNEGYIIHTSNSNEYYLLENRQQQGWDKYILGHGMLVWHIDYDKYLWDMNRVNNTSNHQYVDIVEADNIQSTGTRAGDPFPGTSGVHSFTPQTKPAFIDWSGVDVKVPLTNIREENGIIYLDAAGGGAPLEPIRYVYPVADEAYEITDHSFVAAWQIVDEAEGYYVGLGQMQEGEKQTELADFTGGIDKLNEAWSTNVTSTYSNASYAGAAVPSLRMQHEGDQIQCQHDGISNVSFWCRGSSVKAGTTLEVQWITSDDRVAHTDAYELTTTGTTVQYAVPEEYRGLVSLVNITYKPAAGSGSLAIDDINITYANKQFQPLQEELFTTSNRMLISELKPDTDYAYYVVAAKGNMRSRTSNYVQLHTLPADGSSIAGITPSHTPDAALYNLSGQRMSTVTKPGIYIRNDRKVVVK